jgi:hypothetical protein
VTVTQLIEALSALPGDLEVFRDDAEWGNQLVEHVTIDEQASKTTRTSIGWGQVRVWRNGVVTTEPAPESYDTETWHPGVVLS